MRRLALLFAVLLATPASAATYHLVAKVPVGVMFVDVGSIKKVGNFWSIWTTMFLFKDGADGLTGNPKTAAIVWHDQYDCSSSVSRHLSMQSYDANGYPTDAVDQLAPWKDIVPDSNDSVSERFACDANFAATDTGWTSDMLPMLGTVRSVHGWK